MSAQPESQVPIATESPLAAPLPATGTGVPTVPLRRVVGALLRKELLVELRTLESVPGMSLFALSTFVVFHFALNRNSVEGDLATGVLWVTLLFAALLGVNRLFVADAEEGGLDGFLLAPVDRSALLLAKELTLLVLPGRARAGGGAGLRPAAVGCRSPTPCRTCCWCWRSRTSGWRSSARWCRPWRCRRGRGICWVRCWACRCWCRS